MRAQAYAAGTVINALATNIGCAFGIKLKTKVKISVEDELKKCVVEGEKQEENLIVNRVLMSAGIKGAVEIESEIPKGCGLGSSSAFMNALLVAVMKLKKEELDAYRILTANARISLESGISYTGAFDDASASLLGGFCISNNSKMRLYRRDVTSGKALILIPNWGRGEVSLDKIREESAEIEKAVKEALEGRYGDAMLLNSSFYCRKLEYSIAPLERIKNCKVHAGLSGNGPAFVAFGKKNELKEVEEIWADFGKLIWSELAEKPSEDVIIPDHLFFNYSHSSNFLH
ncbi:MAG TPA: shikimate kinase [Archaeoglobaceae archaeon]|nr:shikimate kinase [Archaeoglobaceae archaeon]